jgi:hypothetical protein
LELESELDSELVFVSDSEQESELVLELESELDSELVFVSDSELESELVLELDSETGFERFSEPDVYQHYFLLDISFQLHQEPLAAWYHFLIHHEFRLSHSAKVFKKTIITLAIKIQFKALHCNQDNLKSATI